MQQRTDHPDADKVFASLHDTMPTLSLDTVYRTLRLFATKGLITQLAVPTHRFRFDGCTDAHDHFLCTRCETIVDIANRNDLPDGVPDAVKVIGEVHATQRVYLGTCRACAERHGQVQRPRRKTTAQGHSVG